MSHLVDQNQDGETDAELRSGGSPVDCDESGKAQEGSELEANSPGNGGSGCGCSHLICELTCVYLLWIFAGRGDFKSLRVLPDPLRLL